MARGDAAAPALAGLAGTRFLLGLADTALAHDEMSRAQKEAEMAVTLDSASQEAREVLSLIRQHRPTRGGEPVVVTRAPPPREPGTGAKTVVAPMPPGMPDTAWFQTMTRFGHQIEEQVRFKGAPGAHDASMGLFVGARGLMAAGLHSEAVNMLSDLVDIAPDMAPAWELLARAQISAGNPQGAVGALEGWSARGGATAPSRADVRSLRDAVRREGARGYWLWQKARLDARLAAGEDVSPLDLAAARAGTGDTDGAFQALEEAVALRDRGLVLLQKDPVWDVLRSDPRFADIARKSRTMQVLVGPPQTARPR